MKRIIIVPIVALGLFMVVLTAFWYTNALQLIIQFVTVLAFLFTAYAWWASARDKKIEPLEMTRGILDYLAIKVYDFISLVPVERKPPKVSNIQKLYGQVSDDLAKSKKRTGNISPQLGTELSNFIHLLYRHSDRGYPETADGVKELEKVWEDEIHDKMDELLSNLNKEIATHRFLKSLWRSLTGYLNRFIHPTKKGT
ncbi:MAG: hypothetical protein ABSF63_12955 [Candidatus Bathyarchaeia archaeon]